MFLKKYGIKSKNIWIIYSAMFLWGMHFFLPIWALYLQESLLTVTNVALIFSVMAFVSAVLEVPSGAFADLFGRKKTLILGAIIYIGSLVFLYFGKSMNVLLIYAVLNAVGSSLFSGTDIAIIYDTLKQENKERLFKKVIGIYYSLWPFGAMVGSVIGGYMAKISLATPVIYTIIPISLGTLLVLFIKEPKYHKEIDSNLFRHMINSFKLIIHSKQLFILLIGGFILWSFGETIHLLNPIFFKAKGLSLELFGWVAAIIFGLSSLGHFIAHDISEKIGNKLTIIISAIFSPLLIVIATLLTKNYAILVFMIPAIFFGLRNPVIDHLINLEVESSKRATINSVHNLMAALGFSIFSPLIGYFAEIYSITTAFRISALAMLVVPILYLFLKEKN